VRPSPTVVGFKKACRETENLTLKVLFVATKWSARGHDPFDIKQLARLAAANAHQPATVVKAPPECGYEKGAQSDRRRHPPAYFEVLL